MLSKIFNTSTEFMFWLSSSYFTVIDCQDIAESDRYGVFFRRQLHNSYAVYWIFKALSRHKSVGCKKRYGLFYTVQACKFVTARFCYRANWTRVGTRTTVLTQTSVCYTRSFISLQIRFLLVWAFVVTVFHSNLSFLVFEGCSKYGKSLEFASHRRVNLRFSAFKFSIMLKSTMYQFEPDPQSTVDAKGSDTPLLTVSVLAVILRLFYRCRLIFLTKMPSYVSYIR